MMSKEDASKSLIRYIKSNTFSVYGRVVSDADRNVVFLF